MRDTIERSVALLTASGRSLLGTEELRFLPLLTFLTCLVELLAFYGLSVLAGSDENFRAFLRQHSVRTVVQLGPRGTLLAFAAICTIRVTNTFMQAAIIGALLPPGADGRQGGASVVRERAGAILGWAVLNATAVAVANWLRSATGVTGRLLGFAPTLLWALASFLALPVLIYEGRSPVQALRRSTALFAATWGEQLTAGFSLAVISVPALAVIATGAGAAWLVDRAAAAPVALVLFMAWSVALSALLSAFRAGLYLYATGQEPLHGFERAPIFEAYRQVDRAAS